MTRFSEGDRVRIIAMPNNGKHFIFESGTIIPRGGIGYESDDIYVKLKNGNIISVKEHQLNIIL
ncbi:MAG TPA: hypothetical protein EYG21_07235 [Nitrospinaceae bacterium]|nr:hypothetical protein [Nitrospinaceae bacterium]